MGDADIWWFVPALNTFSDCQAICPETPASISSKIKSGSVRFGQNVLEGQHDPWNSPPEAFCQRFKIFAGLGEMKNSIWSTPIHPLIGLSLMLEDPPSCSSTGIHPESHLAIQFLSTAWLPVVPVFLRLLSWPDRSKAFSPYTLILSVNSFRYFSSSNHVSCRNNSFSIVAR